MKEGVPAFHIVNICHQKKYSIEKEIITDPFRDILLQQIRFKPSSKNKSSTYNLYVLLAPHIHNRGKENNGWIDDYKGIPMFFTHRDGITLALASSSG